jgi:outer membrane murein-binding lipoprotein Lpp
MFPRRPFLIAALLASATPLFAQEPAPSLEERLLALEQQVVTMDARLAAVSTVGSGSLASSDAGLRAQARIDRLERTVADLSSEVRRLTGQLESVRRDTDAAQRTARNALTTANRAASR